MRVRGVYRTCRMPARELGCSCERRPVCLTVFREPERGKSGRGEPGRDAYLALGLLLVLVDLAEVVLAEVLFADRECEPATAFL